MITTIQAPTASVRALGERLASVGARWVVVGDRKGPTKFEVAGARLLTLQDQRELDFTIATVLPVDHYVRKNLGYLVAIAGGARCIYETDDDNRPGDRWRVRAAELPARRLVGAGWVNVYERFTDRWVWPRGFPLRHVRGELTDRAAAPPVAGEVPPAGPLAPVRTSIQQGLVNGEADVDAMWRMLWDQEIIFEQAETVWLGRGSWCPFNSQNTWWWPEAFELLYLPATCTFRMTDIWRSFVAQRCLWEMDGGVAFYAPDAVQERNPHDLSKDFEDEVPGYLCNERIAQTLEELKLAPGPEAVGENLIACYEALVRADIVEASEMPMVRAWVADVAKARAEPKVGTLPRNLGDVQRA